MTKIEFGVYEAQGPKGVIRVEKQLASDGMQIKNGLWHWFCEGDYQQSYATKAECIFYAKEAGYL